MLPHSYSAFYTRIAGVLGPDVEGLMPHPAGPTTAAAASPAPFAAAAVAVVRGIRSDAAALLGGGAAASRSGGDALPPVTHIEACIEAFDIRSLGNQVGRCKQVDCAYGPSRRSYPHMRSSCLS